MKAKLWERTAFRIIIFLLCVVFTAGSFALIVVGVSRYSDFVEKAQNQISFSVNDIFAGKAFRKSETFHNTVQNQIYVLASLYTQYAVKGGVDIDSGLAYEKAVDESLRKVYENIKSSIWEKSESYNVAPGSYEGETVFEENPGRDMPLMETDYYSGDDWQFSWYGHGYGDFVYGGREILFSEREMAEDPVIAPEGIIKDYDEPGVREAFKELYPEQVKIIQLFVAENRRHEYEICIKTLGAAHYYIGNGEKWAANVQVSEDGGIADMDKLTEQPVWLTRLGTNCESNPPALADSFDVHLDIGGATVCIGWPIEQLTYYEGLYNQVRGIIWTCFFIAAVLLIAAVVLLVLLLVFTGRKRPSFEGTRRLWALDNIFVEFQTIALAILLAIGINALVWFTNGYNHSWIAGVGLYFALFCAGGFALSAGLLWFLLSLVRIGKAGLFVKRSLIGLLVTGPCRALGNAVKSGFDGRNPLAKSLILVVLLWFVTAFFAGLGGVLGSHGFGALLVFGFLLVLVLVGAIYFTYKWVERYGRLRKGVEEIARGNLGYRIEILGDGKNEFDRLSAFVNELGSAQNAALQSELKNQRLKTDLISNVSHDLKTPLTSILTYTDLLKTEGLKSENAGEYLQVIDEKGQRLKKLTDDLFEAAKASSGALTVRKEKVDLLELLEQEIAEMNGSFAEAGLELIVEAPGEHYYVEADSQLLWRVVDNLLRNARKYAQPGTRVYIGLKEHLPGYQAGFSGFAGAGAGGATQGGTDKNAAKAAPIRQAGTQLMTTLEIKNTSATKLNIPPEELMERFKRGDEARATEGSGLGLAIAKDLVRLQSGWFEIAIDGDLFKTVVMLPPYIGQ